MSNAKLSNHSTISTIILKKKRLCSANTWGVIVPNLLNEVDLVCVHDVHVFCACICVCYILY